MYNYFSWPWIIRGLVEIHNLNIDVLLTICNGVYIIVWLIEARVSWQTWERGMQVLRRWPSIFDDSGLWYVTGLAWVCVFNPNITELVFCANINLWLSMYSCLYKVHTYNCVCLMKSSILVLQASTIYTAWIWSYL